MGDDDERLEDSSDVQSILDHTRLDTEVKARSAEEFERRAREAREREERREREGD